MHIMKATYLTPVAALLFGCAIASAQNSSAPSDQPNSDATHSSMRQASASRPDFDTLDTKKKGTLTADDVKGNKWLAKNFTLCDMDHDGTLSREEYAACK
jgi:Ca2+-binding EF-hand superfamily protein